MNDTLTHQEYISYTLQQQQQQPHPQMSGYASLNGGGSGGQMLHLQQQQQPHPHQHQQQYGGVMHHSDLLQQAASGLLATEAPDGPLMMGAGGVVLTLNGATTPTSLHNGAIHTSQSVHQYATLTSPLTGTVLVTNAPPGATSPSDSKQSNTPNGGSSNSNSNSANGNSNGNHSSNTNGGGGGGHSMSKKKRKLSFFDSILFYLPTVYTGLTVSLKFQSSLDFPLHFLLIL